MDYLTPKEAAKKWNLSLRRVQTLCSEHRVSGAVKVGRQWMIPITAQLPKDARTIASNKAVDDFETYHFPILVYTPYYCARSELSKDEQTLLEAQMCYLELKLEDSLHICKKLLKTSTSTSVIIGAYFTIFYTAMLLALSSEVDSALVAIDKIFKSATTHKEDYKLIKGICKLQLFLDPTDLYEIDTMKLSYDATISYKLFSMNAIAVSPSQIPLKALSLYNIICKDIEALGILPALLFAHAALAVISSHSGDVKGEKYHIKLACKIGAENNFYSLLSKWGGFSIDKYYGELQIYGLGDKIVEISEKNSYSYRVVFNALKGKSVFLDMSGIEVELIFLLSYGLTNKKIAEIKNITEKEADKLIREYCKRRGFKNKGELVKFAKDTARDLSKHKY